MVSDTTFRGDSEDQRTKRFEGTTVRFENRTYEKRAKELDLFGLAKNKEGNVTKFLH